MIFLNRILQKWSSCNFQVKIGQTAPCSSCGGWLQTKFPCQMSGQRIQMGTYSKAGRSWVSNVHWAGHPQSAMSSYILAPVETALVSHRPILIRESIWFPTRSYQVHSHFTISVMYSQHQAFLELAEIISSLRDRDRQSKLDRGQSPFATLLGSDLATFFWNWRVPHVSSDE